MAVKKGWHTEMCAGCSCPHTDCAQEHALQLGRDCMEMGLEPFLIRLVGANNARQLLADYTSRHEVPRGETR